VFPALDEVGNLLLEVPVVEVVIELHQKGEADFRCSLAISLLVLSCTLLSIDLRLTELPVQEWL
jgi:hypothetical protein